MSDTPTGETPQGSTPLAGETPTPTEQPLSRDAWLAEQPDEIKTAFQEFTSGLKSALDSERETRQALEKQLKKIARGDLIDRADVQQVIDQLNHARSRAEFYDEAHRHDVYDLGLAYLAAQTAGLLDEKGACDFAALRAKHPKLFAEPRRVPPGNAGAGAGQAASTAPSMNDLIRQAAGRQR